MTTIAPRTVTAHPGPGVDREVTGGVDTHAETHTAAAIDAAGRLLGHATFATTTTGYAQLAQFLRSHGTVVRVGVEGTGAYGAGLARHLAAAGIEVVEVDRPDRKTRRFQGKSDPVDAEAAARAALSGRASGIPKERTGTVEALRVLRVAKASAVTARARALQQLRAVIVTAPEPLRARLRGLGKARLLAECATLRPDRTRVGDPEQAAKVALRTLARRHGAMHTEVEDLEELITALINEINPSLLALTGVGPDVAGQLLVTAGQNPERMTSEAAFAALTGVSPIPASSGRSSRMRLNRGGDRQANSALYTITICRMRWDERTRAYVTRRTQEGKHKKEIIRCLKRYVAREVYTVLYPPTTHADEITLAA